MLIPYLIIGPPGTFQQVSYAQVLYDDPMLADLEGKIIIIGIMMATGMGTRFSTAVSVVNRQPMSDVEWQANIVDMLLHDRDIYPVSNFFASIASVFWVLLVPLLSVFCGSI